VKIRIKGENMNKKLTKADILAANDLPVKKIFVKEWGGTLDIKTLSLNQLNKIRSKKLSNDDFLIEVLSESIIDDNGNFVFSLEEAKQLTEKNPHVIEFIFHEIEILNGFGKDQKKLIEDKEKEIKNDPLSVS
jgi:hypothetical protein